MSERQQGERRIFECAYRVMVHDSPDGMFSGGHVIAEFPFYYRGHAQALSDARLFLAAPLLHAAARCRLAWTRERDLKLIIDPPSWLATFREHGYAGGELESQALPWLEAIERRALAAAEGRAVS